MYNVVNQILPKILQIGWVSYICLSADDSILMKISFDTNTCIKLEIDDEANIVMATSNDTYHDFTLETLLEYFNSSSEKESD